MEKMTKKEMFAFIKEALADNTEVAEFCDKEIASIEKKAAKAKETAAAKKAATDELAEAVASAMSDTEFEPIATIAGRIQGEDVTVAKVTYRLNQLVKDGKAEKSEISIPATETSRARKIMGFKLIG